MLLKCSSLGISTGCFFQEGKAEQTWDIVRPAWQGRLSISGRTWDQGQVLTMALKLQNEVYCKTKDDSGSDETVFPLVSVLVRYVWALVYVFFSSLDISYIMTQMAQLHVLVDTIQIFIKVSNIYFILSVY